MVRRAVHCVRNNSYLNIRESIEKKEHVTPSYDLHFYM